MNTKQLETETRQDASGRIVAKITTTSVDRDGEVLIPQGMNARDFEKNPILFYNHDYAVPIGKLSNLRRGGKSVEAELKFAQRPDGYEGDFFPSFVEALVRQGIVKGISVGFVPEDGGVRTANRQDKTLYGSECGRVYNKWKLLEVSVAPLPANQDALVQSVGKGIVSRAQVKNFMGIDLPDTPIRQTITLRPSKKRVSVKLSTKARRRAEIQDEIRVEVARQRGQIYL